jgi:hypothetical protein
MGIVTCFVEEYKNTNKPNRKQADCRMPSSGMLRRVFLVRADVSEELNTSVFKVTRICELGTTLAVTSNRPTLRSRSIYCHRDYGGAKFLRNVGPYKIHTA